jgi:hypothetical protein
MTTMLGDTDRGTDSAGADQLGLFGVDDTGGIELPGPELAPALEPIPDRWLWGAAVVTADALMLPDGEAFGLDGMTHLGDLVDLAAHLRLGSGGGKSYPYPPQVFLTSEALARFWVELPAELLGTRTADRATVAAALASAGRDALAAAAGAGYAVSGAFRAWFRMWRANPESGDSLGARTVQFVVLPVARQVPDAAELLSGTPAQIASRVERFTRLLGAPFTWSGGVTGRVLYDRLHPAGGRARTPIELVDPIKLLRSAGSVAGHTAFKWMRPLSSAEAHMQWCHGYDGNGARLSAVGQATLGVGEPEHHRPGRAFDKKLPGLWKIAKPEPDNVLLPPIVDGRAAVGSPVWVYTPTLAYLRELGQDPEILECYVWPESRRLFATWAKTVDTGRLSIKHLRGMFPADPDLAAVGDAVKAVYTGFVGRFAYAGERGPDGRALSPWHRPDWNGTVVALERVNLHRKLTRFGAQTGRWPVAVFTDEALYTADGPDAAVERPEPMTLGMTLGSFKTSRSGGVSPDLLAACVDGDQAAFDRCVPKPGAVALDDTEADQ